MHFESIIEQLDSEQSCLVVPSNWAQGRTVYGGLSAALIYHRMNQWVKQHKPNENRVIRSLDLSFIGPLMVNEPLNIEVVPLRSGRSATQLMAQIKQNKQICVMAQACFGIKRESKIRITEQFSHDMNAPQKAKFIPQIPKVTPKFLRHIDLSLHAGKLPFMHSKKDYLQGWMRFKKTPQFFKDEHMIALIDAWPCTILQQLKLPAMASTMNWNLQFTQTAQSPKPDQWLAYQATTAHAADGYVFGNAQVFNQVGELLAVSRQTVGVFA